MKLYLLKIFDEFIKIYSSKEEKQDNILTKRINVNNERASNFPSLNFNLHYICQ